MFFKEIGAPTLCCCRVSSHDQKADLDRKQELLETHCSAKGWRTQAIRDLGSGMNYRKKRLNQLLELIMKRQIIEIVIIHRGEQPSFEEKLACDVLEIIMVFSARLYGSRSKKHKKMLEALQDATGSQS